jgi:hypothetical protein
MQTDMPHKPYFACARSADEAAAGRAYVDAHDNSSSSGGVMFSSVDETIARMQNVFARVDKKVARVHSEFANVHN